MAALPMLVAPRQQYLLGPATWSLPFAASPWRAMHGAALSLFNRFAHTQLRTRVEVGASLAVRPVAGRCQRRARLRTVRLRLFRTAGGVVASRFLPPALLVLGTGRARGARPRVSTVAAGSRAQARGFATRGARCATLGLRGPVARASGSVGKCGVFGGGMAEDSFWGSGGARRGPLCFSVRVAQGRKGDAVTLVWDRCRGCGGADSAIAGSHASGAQRLTGQSFAKRRSR
ncbi:hypothetical protein ERJ75_001122600 [Trypanosoma vivax]|nr:hypothetical protein ERJ75_001122600 [Trypanosoma vivax]